MKDAKLFEHHKHREGKAEPYHYRECGLDNIWLLGGYSLEDTPDGELLFVEDQEALHRVIGLSIINRGDPITGRELWFLRQELKLTQERLARLLNADVQAVARWEKGRSRIPGPADRLIRYLYLDSVCQELNADKAPDIREFLEALAELDRITDAKRVFQPTPRGWEPAAA